jgi:hypothetical protein
LWHDALFANQFVSFYTQRIHRGLLPRQQQFCRRRANAGTSKRENPFICAEIEKLRHSVLKSSGTPMNFLITLPSLKSPVAGRRCG